MRLDNTSRNGGSRPRLKIVLTSRLLEKRKRCIKIKSKTDLLDLIIEKRGIDTYNTLEQAEDDWGDILDYTGYEKEELALLLINDDDIIESTQIISVIDDIGDDNGFYVWFSKYLDPEKEIKKYNKKIIDILKS